MALHMLVIGCPGLKLGESTQERTPMNTMLLKLYVKFQDLMNREEGQDLVEYALVIALISIAAVASLNSLTNTVKNVFNTIIADM
jgi:pilus assembly protein Flp/PilA